MPQQLQNGTFVKMRSYQNACFSLRRLIVILGMIQFLPLQRITWPSALAISNSSSPCLAFITKVRFFWCGEGGFRSTGYWKTKKSESKKLDCFKLAMIWGWKYHRTTVYPVCLTVSVCEQSVLCKRQRVKGRRLPTFHHSANSPVGGLSISHDWEFSSGNQSMIMVQDTCVTNPISAKNSPECKIVRKEQRENIIHQLKQQSRLHSSLTMQPVHELV